jgi:hypothetical protein
MISLGLNFYWEILLLKDFYKSMIFENENLAKIDLEEDVILDRPAMQNSQHLLGEKMSMK